MSDAKPLRHYAHCELGPIRDAEQDTVFPFKPKGLWLSVEDGYGWREWCEAEEFRLGWTHVYDVTLTTDANILWIESVADLDAFNAEYLSEPIDGQPYLTLYPEWWMVAKKYDGLVIAPYQWERRMNLMWYYSWDCSSGCIWNADAIDNVSEVVFDA